MARSELLYLSDTISACMVTAEYTSAYTEQNFNVLPSISFPLISGFEYRAGSARLMLDTNQVLFERGQTEFKVSKFPVFNTDVTLCIEMLKPEGETFSCFGANKKQVSTGRRTVELDVALRCLLPAMRGTDTMLKEQLLNNIIELTTTCDRRDQQCRSGQYQLMQIDRAKEFIHARYKDEISVADIAASVHLSPFYFSRLFRRVTGYSPYDHLQLVRIEHAKLLLRTEMPVTQVAFDTGFNSLDNFSYAFSRIAGCSPMAYKKSRISKVAVKRGK